MSAEYLIIASSLHHDSNSRILAEQLTQIYGSLNANVEIAHLRDHPLPMCDGGAAYGDPNVAWWSAKIAAARVIIVATPVYNYDANAAAKNLLELTGRNWENKVVGFLCAAGGAMSYMSIMGLANSLMLDFRSLIIPRFVYAVEPDFADGKITNPEVEKRLQLLAAASLQIRNAA